MPSVEITGDQLEDTVQTPAPATKATVGIIYPPPEVRNIVDKTASFVARNGPEFESRIRQNELNNPKFNFLNLTDPYHNYYRHKVKEFVEGKGQEPAVTLKSGFGFLQQKAVSEQIKIIESLVPKEPPPEFEFVADPPSISASDLDVVRLTAQFVARNGRQFLNNLMNREQRNFQFDFLRPQHSLFNYFTKLVEQYTKILLPPKDLLAKLRLESEEPSKILNQCKYRVEWGKHQERERKREEDEREKVRIAYAQIDWHDFVVVETVDYQPNEIGNFPQSTTPQEVGARIIAQERYEQDGEPEEKVVATEEEKQDDAVNVDASDEEDEDDGEDNSEEEDENEPDKKTPGADTRVQDMEEDSDTEEDANKMSDFLKNSIPLPPSFVSQSSLGTKVSSASKQKDDSLGSIVPPPPLPLKPEQVIIRKDYDPKAPKLLAENPNDSADKFLISPITGEKIPADKIQEHMRIGLLDPKWIEQRDRTIQEKRDQEEVYAPGSSIGSNLKQLAERRTDIFGSGAEETQIGKKIGEEEKKDKGKIIWDGHSTSMEKVSQKARENITIEDQIAVIHKTKGLVADEEKEKIGPAMPRITGSGGGFIQNIANSLIASNHQQMSSQMQLQPQPSASLLQSSPQFPSLPPLPPSSSMPTPSQPLPVQSNQMQQQQPPLPRPPMNVPPRPPMGHMPPMMVMMPPQPPGISGMVRPPMPPQMVGNLVSGVRPQFMPPVPQMGNQPPPPPQMPVQQMGGIIGGNRPLLSSEDEPSSKKIKTEEQLIPENVFLSQNSSPVTFRIVVPTVEKSEWKLLGQCFAVTLPLTDSVSVVKAKIFDEIGVPAGKQKLQLDGLFMKDSNNLAYYNFSPTSLVQLQLKERGGRKK